MQARRLIVARGRRGPRKPNLGDAICRTGGLISAIGLAAMLFVWAEGYWTSFWGFWFACALCLLGGITYVAVDMAEDESMPGATRRSTASRAHTTLPCPKVSADAARCARA